MTRGWAGAMLLLLVAPALAWVLGAAAVTERLAGDRRVGLRRAFVVFGYMFVPIGLAMHLAHNLSHLLLEGGGIVPVVERAVAVYRPSSGSRSWPDSVSRCGRTVTRARPVARCCRWSCCRCSSRSPVSSGSRSRWPGATGCDAR